MKSEPGEQAWELPTEAVREVELVGARTGLGGAPTQDPESASRGTLIPWTWGDSGRWGHRPISSNQSFWVLIPPNYKKLGKVWEVQSPAEGSHRGGPWVTVRLKGDEYGGE